MKKKYKILIITIFLVILPLLAPLGVEGGQPRGPLVKYCVKFVNLGEFEGYTFIRFNLNAYGKPFEIIENDKCFERLDDRDKNEFYAIKNKKFDIKELKYSPPSYLKYLQGLTSKEQDYLKEILGKLKWTRQVFKNNAVSLIYLRRNKEDLIPIDIELKIPSSSDSEYFDQRVERSFKLISTADGFKAEKIKDMKKPISSFQEKGFFSKGNLLNYLLMLIATVLIEVLPFGFLSFFSDSDFKKSEVLKIFLINLVTTTIVFILFFQGILGFYLVGLMIFLAELLLFMTFLKFKFLQALFYSFSLNLISGFFLFILFSV